MKTLTFQAITTLLMITMISPAAFADEDTVSMSPGYVTDIYYNLETGVELTSPREIWDIAFSTHIVSASILINDGSGVELYTWGNGDTTGWANVDTNGMSTWGALFNDPEDWENGAFNRNASDHPDYGWGKYNNFTHEVIGDSLYILKRPDGSLYKLWIKKKGYSSGFTSSVYTFKIAAIDGSGETTKTIDCGPYSSKNFIYYSIPANQFIDREPASSDWDFLFTKYMAMHPTGSPYIVTGVLSNYDLQVAEVTGVSQYLYNDYTSHPYDTTRSVIGYDWKYFDLNTFSYLVDDSTVFFIEEPSSGDIWKLFFEIFEGTSTGNIVFQKFNVSTSGIEEVAAGEEHMFLYPNPASEQSVLTTNIKEGNTATARIMDMSGRLVFENTIMGQASAEETNISLDKFQPGMYIMLLQEGAKVSSTKFIVK